MKRHNVNNSNNDFFRLAFIVSPDVKDCETIALIETCYSLLWPLKQFIVDHPDIAKEYRGLLPISKEIKAYWNNLEMVREYGWQIKGTATFADHIRLQQLTNNMSDLTGIPAVTINTWMFKQGYTIRSTGQTQMLQNNDE
jgi:hypothetical protein